MVAAVKKMNVNKLFLSHSSMEESKNLLGCGGDDDLNTKTVVAVRVIIIPCAEPERNEMRSKKRKKGMNPLEIAGDGR